MKYCFLIFVALLVSPSIASPEPIPDWWSPVQQAWNYAVSYVTTTTQQLSSTMSAALAPVAAATQPFTTTLSQYYNQMMTGMSYNYQQVSSATNTFIGPTIHNINMNLGNISQVVTKTVTDMAATINVSAFANIGTMFKNSLAGLQNLWKMLTDAVKAFTSSFNGANSALNIMNLNLTGLILPSTDPSCAYAATNSIGEFFILVGKNVGTCFTDEIQRVTANLNKLSGFISVFTNFIQTGKFSMQPVIDAIGALATLAIDVPAASGRISLCLSMTLANSLYGSAQALMGLSDSCSPYYSSDPEPTPTPKPHSGEITVTATVN